MGQREKHWQDLKGSEWLRSLSVVNIQIYHQYIDWLNDWMVFYAAFNRISDISWEQLTLFTSFLGFTSTRRGLWSVLPKDTPTKKPRGSSVARTQDPYIMSQHQYIESKGWRFLDICANLQRYVKKLRKARSVPLLILSDMGSYCIRGKKKRDRSQREPTWVETFCYRSFFCMTKDQSTSWCRRSWNKMNFMYKHSYKKTCTVLCIPKYIWPPFARAWLTYQNTLDISLNSFTIE